MADVNVSLRFFTAEGVQIDRIVATTSISGRAHRDWLQVPANAAFVEVEQEEDHHG